MADKWVGQEPTKDSPYYPYRKVVEANTLAGIENLPYILTKYLMDLPMPGYTPPSDNVYPRARLKKLIYWDCANPLDQPLPTTEQMLSIRFNPEAPGSPPDPKKGYRIFSQELVRQSQTDAQTILRIYLGDTRRQKMNNIFVFRQQVLYTVMVNYSLEANLKATANSRASSIVQAIQEATEGVNFGGLGSMHTFQITKFDDERTNTGYKIYQDIDWAASAPNPFYEGK